MFEKAVYSLRGWIMGDMGRYREERARERRVESVEGKGGEEVGDQRREGKRVE